MKYTIFQFLCMKGHVEYQKKQAFLFKIQGKRILKQLKWNTYCEV